MTSQISFAAGAVPDLDLDVDLDVQFASVSPAVGELFNSTRDGCGSSGESACAGCVTD